MQTKEKIKAWKILQQHPTYRQAFISLGASWYLTPEAFHKIQKFTCQLYSKRTKITKVNDLHYQMFCAKNEDIESEQLPPCEDMLRQHTFHANYQAAIWRHSLERLPDIPEPSAGHGWELNTEGNLTIQWMTGEAAPNAVLSLISCKCTRRCHYSDCSCMLNGLKCTIAYKFQNRSNMAQESVEDIQDIVYEPVIQILNLSISWGSNSYSYFQLQ